MKNLIITFVFYIWRAPLLTNTQMFPYLATLCAMDIFPSVCLVWTQSQEPEHQISIA